MGYDVRRRQIEILSGRAACYASVISIGVAVPGPASMIIAGQNNETSSGESGDAGMTREQAVEACFWEIFQTPSSDVKVSSSKLLTSLQSISSDGSGTLILHDRQLHAAGWLSSPDIAVLTEVLTRTHLWRTNIALLRATWAPLCTVYYKAASK